MALLLKARENRLAALDRIARQKPSASIARVRRPEGPALFIARRAA